MWPASYSGLPGGPPRVQRTSASDRRLRRIEQSGQLCGRDQHGWSTAHRHGPASRRAGAGREARPRYRPREPTTMMAAAEHLVRDLRPAALPSASGPGACRRSRPDRPPAPSRRRSCGRCAWLVHRTSTARATCSISILSQSSTSRCEPGNSRVGKSVRRPMAKTSICSSSTIRAS